MDKPRYIIVTRTFVSANDDVEARRLALEVQKAAKAVMHLMPSGNTQLDVKLQKLVTGKPPEGIQL
jgi:hypothetical protein